MSILSGKKILLGVTGGIAAYKTPYLVRCFIKAGAQVRVVMTPAAKDFVTPLSLATLSKNEVYSSFTEENDDGEQWHNHVALGLWADLMLVAPATANTLSKMAHGACDNMLLATYLSAKCPVYYAPAMDLDMYRHGSTKKTFSILEGYNNIQIPAAHGELASGLVGQGRMAEPETIISFIENHLLDTLPLRSKKVLITAGPTFEAIDPVRFIGNHSSGKMGFEIAKAAANLGAEVVLISGPTHLELSHDSITLLRVINAQEMYEAVHQHYKTSHIAILAAAVADYKPKEVSVKKIKKKDDNLSLNLVRTKDILASLGAQKENQFLVGFALETDNEIENAKIKLKKKNLDLIVLNSLNDPGAGFKNNTNKVTFISQDQSPIHFKLKTKAEVATDILQHIIKHLDE